MRLSVRFRSLSAIATLLTVSGPGSGLAQQPVLRPLSVPAAVSTLPSEPLPYVLGPGDQLLVSIFEAPEYSTPAPITVLGDGSVSLPRLGRLQAQGKTVEVFQRELEQRLGAYLQRPIVTVAVTAARPLRVSVTGEVQRPGPYTLTQTEANQLTGTAVVGVPTLADAIAKAGGVRQFADLRRVEIRRQTLNQGRITLACNLWDLISTGDLKSNPLLVDGDEIVIPRARQVQDDEILVAGVSTISPAVIRVNVVGEVKSPGTVQVPANTPLNQAILAAGGFTPRSDDRTVSLIRLNLDGTAVNRSVAANFSTGLAGEQNPPLRDGDSIVVYPNSFTAINDQLAQITQALNPITPIVGLLGIFGVRFSN